MNVVKNIRKIRIEKGLNQDIISEALGLNPSVASNIENGKRELKVSDLGKIAKALEVDVLYLFTYPKHYIDADSLGVTKEQKVVISFEVSPRMRDRLLELFVQEAKEQDPFLR